MEHSVELKSRLLHVSMLACTQEEVATPHVHNSFYDFLVHAAISTINSTNGHVLEKFNISLSVFSVNMSEQL